MQADQAVAPVGDQIAGDPPPTTGDRWSLLGVRMSAATVEQIAAQCSGEWRDGTAPVLVACANLHSLATASRDGAFLSGLKAMTHVTADGAPVRLAGRLLGEPVGPRVTGYDVFQRVMARLDARDGRALFVGSVPRVLELICRNSARDYPRVTVDALSPPFGDLTGEPTARILARIEEFRPDVVLVGMSAPKQEIWAARNATAMDVAGVVCIGAVFNYYAGTLKRAPAWARRIGCEWLFRLAQEPRRVWRKYFISGPIFAGLIWREWRRRRFGRLDR